MSRKVRADIDLDAIRQNYRLAQQQSDAKAVAIVKADAYGHGAVQVARALAQDAKAFGVACIEEAIELRIAGINGQPVILLEGFFDAEELPVISRENFWPAVHSFWQLEALENAALEQSFSVLVKIDTGMHRLGFQPEDVPAVIDRLQALPFIDDVILMTHFARADEMDRSATLLQLERYEQARAGRDVKACLSNSAAVMEFPEAHHEWMRPGIMLYGVSPFPEEVRLSSQLRRAMTLSTEIMAIREIQPGETVGYSATYTAERPTRIGTIAMGYGDGYPRQAKNGTPVFVCGKRAPVAGRVSMDMMTIDLTDVPEAKVGDRVELFGNNLPVEEVAAWANTISYIMMTGLMPRVPRHYSGGDAE